MRTKDTKNNSMTSSIGASPGRGVTFVLSFLLAWLPADLFFPAFCILFGNIRRFTTIHTLIKKDKELNRQPVSYIFSLEKKRFSCAMKTRSEPKQSYRL